MSDDRGGSTFLAFLMGALTGRPWPFSSRLVRDARLVRS
jgi:hypothetical protein